MRDNDCIWKHIRRILANIHIVKVSGMQLVFACVCRVVFLLCVSLVVELVTVGTTLADFSLSLRWNQLSIL